MKVKCPKCGYENNYDDTSKGTECILCGVVFEKFALYQEQNKKITELEPEAHQINDVTLLNEEKEGSEENPNVSSVQKKNNKINLFRYIGPIIAVSITIFLVISFAGYRIYLNIEKKNNEKKYMLFVSTISSDLMTLASNSESVVDEVNKEWRDAIFSEYFKRDFNNAIRDVMVRRGPDILEIEKLSMSISEKIKNMEPPPGRENDYKRLKEIYLLFNKYSNMAVSPTGSLQTYSQLNNELSVEILSTVKELDMMVK